jgi:FG-GAP-like repeat
LLGALLLLSACHGGAGGFSNGAHASPGNSTLGIDTFPATSKITLQRRPLVGYSGALAFVPDGWPPHLVATTNDGNGNLTVQILSNIGLGSMYTAPRVAYDVRAADFDGDGDPDLISSVYMPTNVASWTWLYLATAPGLFQQQTSFGLDYEPVAGQPGYRGRTETVVVADFANSGALDVFLPTYSYLDSQFDLSGNPSYIASGPPPDVYNAYQSFLLLNDGTGTFRDVAVTAGVSMHSQLSGIAAPSTDPNGNQPEGAQAVDFNMDGLIDLYVGGHLFINQGVDSQGVPHFKDMAAAWGLTDAVLRAAPPWAPAASNQIPANYLLTDEGAKFLDWNNAGHLDVLLLRWNWGPAHGPRLFEFDGSRFIERLSTPAGPGPTCSQPPSTGTPFFLSDRPTTTLSPSAGINAYDLDNDGLEDVVVTGDTSGSAVFHNTGCGFVEVAAGDLTLVPGSSGSPAFADLDGDGRIDLVYGESNEHGVYMNQTATPTPSSFSVEVFGPNGERNQFGRVIQVLPPGTSQIFTRAVDSGSGYLSQNQYPILVGTPFPGAHTVKVYFAPLTPCLYQGSAYTGPYCQAAVLSFTISPGEHALAYAPSAAHPTGTATVLPGLH